MSMADRHTRLCVVLTAALLWLPGSLSAQEPDSNAPLHVSLADNTAWVERNGQMTIAETGHILAVGDRLRTQTGRVELLFSDGTALHLDVYSMVEVLDDGVVRLLVGQMFLYVSTGAEEFSAAEYRVETPTASVRTSRAGTLRVSVLREPEVSTELAVARGRAWLLTDRGQLAVQAGERARARTGQGPGAAVFYDTVARNDFEEWSSARRSALDAYVAPVLLRLVFQENVRVAEQAIRRPTVEDAPRGSSVSPSPAVPRDTAHSRTAVKVGAVVLRGRGIHRVVDTAPEETDDRRAGSISSTVDSNARRTRLRMRNSDATRTATPSADGPRFRFSGGTPTVSDAQ